MLVNLDFLDQPMKEWDTPFIESIYSVNGNYPCNYNDEPVLVMPW